MDEASKTKKILLQEYPDIFNGVGIDIGCGRDPVTSDCDRYDKSQGDANTVCFDILNKRYDWVFSSHCLEHMYNPKDTINNWWTLVKQGGLLIVIVPDEDLYEQYVWPSTYNRDHKHTFTINKLNSWSPVSINVLDLYNGLDSPKELIKLQVQDHNYRYGIKRVDQTLSDATAQICLIVKKLQDGV